MKPASIFVLFVLFSITVLAQHKPYFRITLNDNTVLNFKNFVTDIERPSYMSDINGAINLRMKSRWVWIRVNRIDQLSLYPRADSDALHYRKASVKFRNKKVRDCEIPTFNLICITENSDTTIINYDNIKTINYY